jgi:hypothetical protein
VCVCVCVCVCVLLVVVVVGGVIEAAASHTPHDATAPWCSAYRQGQVCSRTVAVAGVLGVAPALDKGVCADEAIHG